MSAAPTPALPTKTIASHVAVPIVVGIIMALCYVGGFGKPDPHELRIDVVGTDAQTAVAVQQLQSTLGDAANIRTIDTVDAARTEIEHRNIAAAFVPGGAEAQLLVTTAGGDTTAVTVERIFSGITIAKQQPLHIIDVVSTNPDKDPSGQNIFFFLVALTVGAYGTGIAIAVAGAGRHIKVRLGFAVGAGIVVATLATLIANYAFNALPGQQWATYGFSVLYAITVMLVAVGLHPFIGRFTTLAMVTIFVGLNFTTCGGVFSPQLQSGFFGALHSFWIGAGFNEAIRNIVYFPAVGIGSDIGILVGWALAALALVGAAAVVEARRHPRPAAPVGRHEEHNLRPEQLEELEEDVVA